ncbi:MAG: chromate efflux transporter [Myxococcota bacterium]
MNAPISARGAELRELAVLFLRLGTTAFGGPAAHIAMFEEEVVRRRKWLSHEEFLDLLSATNLIPGPNSTEMAIHIGHRRAGWMGLIVAGACFILPAAFIVGGLAWVYVRHGQLPEAAAALYGVKPVILGVVAQALWNLGKAAIKSWPLGLLAVVTAACSFLGVHELLLLAGAGAVMAVARRAAPALRGGGPAVSVAPWGWAVVAAAFEPTQLGKLFLVFLKIGSVLYGSGYVLLAFLRADLVERLGWLTEGQLLDAVAVGQVTPGPVFTTATFIGYVLGGWPGAVLATVGIFLPAFVFVALSGPLVPRLRRSPTAGAVLDGVNVASLSLMAVVSWQLGSAAIVDVWTGAIAVIGCVALLWARVNATWLVLGGAAAGLAIRALG